ncbi:MAG: hypothetical protein IKR44_06935 [Bacteroidales bacterium]|jgi:outer membrane lipoprotein-sorting protein|nr:hypothetical protein [Bacteroidales bacterium]
MKKFFLIVVALAAFASLGYAQTADEIVERMDKELKKGESVGTAVTFDIHIPIIGQVSSRIRTLGNRSRADIDAKGEKGIIWVVKDTSWSYSPKDNEIVIELGKKDNGSSQQGNEMLSGITEGYNVSIVKETADSWQLRCDKAKGNKDKDDPAKMDLVVAKKTWLPVSLKAKYKGVTVTLRDFSLGVSRKEVTFNPSDYKGVKIIDKRSN